jgi:hypothetical protein
MPKHITPRRFTGRREGKAPCISDLDISWIDASCQILAPADLSTVNGAPFVVNCIETRMRLKTPMGMGTHKTIPEFCLLGYNAMQYVESQRTFRRNMFPPSSGMTRKPSKKQA